MFLFEDYEKIFGKIMNVDVVVFGASNYINSVSAPIKALFDRFSYVTHCQILTGKFGCSVCTAVGSGDDEVLKYMDGFSQILALPISEVSVI